MSKVVVTGMGVVSAIGIGVPANLQRLRAAQSGIRLPEHVGTRYAEHMMMGEVEASDADLFAQLNLADTHGITRTELLAFMAFREAVAQAGLTDTQISASDTALISATTVGGMVQAQALYDDAHAISNATEFAASYRSGAHTLRLAQGYRMRGYTDTINTACSSSANAIMIGARLLKAGRARRVIVGGTDSLSKYTVNGFNALQILSDVPTRPFSADRKGLSLGEGAAYLVLEREDDLSERKALACVSGYANRCDAYHPSSMSPEAIGVIGAMTGALQVAGLAPSDIDHVNTHGTGTQNNDYTELFGLEQVLGTVPPFFSTKSYTGHTLAAAGAVEAVFSILSILHGEVWPSLHFTSPIEGLHHSPNTQMLAGLDIRHVMSNSFGFGGNCSSVIYSKL